MGQVIVITSGKGGVGKTTTTANLGTALARLGKKVCVMDADIGLRNLDIVMGLENRIVYTWYDLVDPEITEKPGLRQVLIKDKRLPNTLYLAPAPQNKEKKDVTAEQMTYICKLLADEFDYVLLDCPAGIEEGFKNTIVAADRAVIVCNPEVSSMRDADRVIGLWEAREQEKEPPVLIVNRVRPHMVERKDMLEVDDIVEMLGIDLLGVIPEDEHIVVSSNKGEPAVFDGKSKAGAAFENTARRLMGEQVEILPLRTDGLWDWLKRAIGL